MRRSLLHRLTALLIAGAFGLGSGASAVAELHCPHHTGAHGAPERHDVPEHHGVPGDPAECGGSHDEGHCGCMGPCQVPAAPLAERPPDGSRVAMDAADAPTPPQRTEAGPQTHPYFLPFANGPPATS